MLPLVLELGQDIIWRVRRAVMVSVPLLTERMGVNYFEENLLELYLQVMTRLVREFCFHNCACTVVFPLRMTLIFFVPVLSILVPPFLLSSFR